MTAYEPLSPAEYRILRLRAEGFPIAVIAEQLGIARQTVKNHLGATYSALGVSNSLAAVKAMGWLQPPDDGMAAGTCGACPPRGEK